LAWRLGLEAILRQVLGRRSYTSLPTVPSRTWTRGFQDFCQLMDQRIGLGLPDGIDYAAFEAQGWRHSVEARALGIVRGRFRRPIEVWIALDRAQSLAERGWRVQVGTFCTPQVTPRNVLILADR
jgi:hypothetical protein